MTRWSTARWLAYARRTCPDVPWHLDAAGVLHAELCAVHRVTRRSGTPWELSWWELHDRNGRHQLSGASLRALVDDAYEEGLL